MSLKRLMARVACHQKAIGIARQAGMTWAEIGERLEMPGESARKAFSRATAAMQSGQLVPAEQAPLPDLPNQPPIADRARITACADPDPEMVLRNLQPATRVARVLPLVDAIRDARARGITWVQIVTEVGAQVGVDPIGVDAANAMRVAYLAACRYAEKQSAISPTEHRANSNKNADKHTDQ